MSDYTDHHILKYPTSECTDKCTGLCGYCPEHEKAHRDDYGDWLIGPEPCRWDRGEGRATLYLATSSSRYPKIIGYENNLQYGRGHMKTSVPYGLTFTHENAGMLVPAIAGKGRVFGLQRATAYVLTVGGRCWRY
tara:strand:- start:1324 stop:1728 length:405 start_codon:yes stop_codon:yes gene_type:complete